MEKDEMKKRVKAFVENNPNKDDVEIAEALDLNLLLVMDILLELEREGEVVDVA